MFVGTSTWKGLIHLRNIYCLQTNLEKRKNDHRICKSEALVEIQADKRGRIEMRCPDCAAARRNCYWKEPDKGIDDYDKAVTFYNGTRVPGNTRRGREHRALRRNHTGERVEVVSEDDGDAQVEKTAGQEVDDEAAGDGAAGDDSDGDDRKIQDDVNVGTDGELDWNEDDDPDSETDDADDELKENVKEKGGDDGSGTGEDEDAKGVE